MGGALIIMFSVLVLLVPIGSCSFDQGKEELCKKQFSGEMHEGKCMKVQREDIK